VCLAPDGKPSSVEILKGDEASNLFRVEHGSAGSSFPGFNLPTPLRSLHEAPLEDLVPAIARLLALNKQKATSPHELSEAIAAVFRFSKPREFSPNQHKQFGRSCGELVAELQDKMVGASAGLTNFVSLLTLVAERKPTLRFLADSLAEVLATGSDDGSRESLRLFQDILFGVLDWKKRRAAVATPDYWTEKAHQAKNAHQPIYLDLAEGATHVKRIAHRDTSALINSILLAADAGETAPPAEAGATAMDAYTGQPAQLQDKFPVGPKVAELGNLKLFSLNTTEVQALLRYRLEGSQAFPIAAGLVQKMSDVLLHLASEDKRGISCRAIPSTQPDKRDLLVAYIEGEPEFREQMAEMFGGEASLFSDADFAAIARPVIEMLEGRIAANPNLNVRLLSFCPIDKAKKANQSQPQLPGGGCDSCGQRVAGRGWERTPGSGLVLRQTRQAFGLSISNHALSAGNGLDRQPGLEH